MDLGITGAMNLPVVERLREVHRATPPGTKQRLNAALPVIAQLESMVTPVIEGNTLYFLLKVGSFIRKDLPSPDKVRTRWNAFKFKMRKDPKFVKLVADTLPEIAANYTASNIMSLVTDQRFLNLLEAANDR